MAQFSPTVVETQGGWNVIDGKTGSFLAGPFASMSAAQDYANTITQLENSSVTSPPQEDAKLGAEDGAVSTVGGNSETRTDAQTQGGVCAAPDDWISQFKTPVGTATGDSVAGRPTIPTEFTERIVSRPNRLAKLASQTYGISIYMITKEDYAVLVQSNKKVLPPGNRLLMQSGGMAVGNRSPYFDVDFYIDEVTIDANAPGVGTGGPNSTVSFTMSVIEPNGITLLQRINAQAKALYGEQAGETGLNNSQINYLMVIRFYGYDEDGNLISTTEAGYNESGSDVNSLIEKFYPFTVSNITYQISSKLVEYNWSCVIQSMDVAFGSIRGTIPFPGELSAPDVKTLLGGVAAATGGATEPGSSLIGAAIGTKNAVTGAISGTRSAISGFKNAIASGNPADIASYTKATLSTVSNGVTSVTNALSGFTAPPKASAISSVDESANKGLVEMLNDWQKKLVKEGSQEFPDIYNIEIANLPGLIDAKIIKPGDQVKSQAPMNESDNPSKKQLDSKNNYNKETKKWSLVPGTQIVQFIDMVMKESTFISSQSNTVYSETDNKVSKQEPAKVVQWYSVSPKIVPYQYDKKRNMYALKITYVIAPRIVNDTRSPYFAPSNKYRGQHKSYNWWFTGLNTEVLEWNIEVTNNMSTPFGSGSKNTTPLASNPDFGASETRSFQTRPNQTSQGGQLQSTMPAASLAERLYTEADILKIDLSILGDPDWLIQDIVMYNTINLSAWAPDGSCNAVSGGVFFEMLWNAPTDYNLQSGIMPVSSTGDFTFKTNLNSSANQRALYTATKIKSIFKDGKFTQKIEGNWAQLTGYNATNALSGSDTSDGQTAKEAAQDTQSMEEDADTIRAATEAANAETDTIPTPEYDPKQIDAAADEATLVPSATSRYAGPVDLSGFDDGASAPTQNQAREA